MVSNRKLLLSYRLVRFRWYQGFYPAGSQPVTWAIDNVYIGPQCEEMCNGHGSCINGTKCICDPNYSGPTCKICTKNPDFLKDDFEGMYSNYSASIFVHFVCHLSSILTCQTELTHFAIDSAPPPPALCTSLVLFWFFLGWILNCT